MGKGHSFQNLLLGKLNMHKIKRKKKFDPYITPDTKINSKWIKDLNVTGNTTKLLEGNRAKLHNTELGDDLVEMAPKAQAGKKIR